MRPLPRPFSLLAVVVLPLALEATARAQTLPSIDVRTWRPSTDPGASLVTEPVGTPGAGNWNVGSWLSYTNSPVTLRDAATGDVASRPVQHLVGLDLVGSLGLGDRAALGLALPTYLYQDGTSRLPSTVVTASGVPQSGIGDLAITGKGTILKNDSGGFGLAALGAFTLPTGDRASFLGDGSATASLRALADLSFVVASLQASLGYTLRTDHHVWPDPSVGGVTFGDSIPFSLGLRLRPSIFHADSGDRQLWEVAAHGALPAGPVGPFGTGDPGSSQLSSVLVTASDRIALGHYKDSFVLLGVDVGLTTAVGVPTVRGVAALGWAPREHDMDHDGVPDDVDQCPEIPEDKDGFEDSDGCPDIDNDDDGIIDKEDACPNVPGVPSDDPKKNGCPPGDSDGDGIPDNADACPTLKGIPSDDPKKNGCPDRDHDGIIDPFDKCPDQPEDKDGFQDEDGCPDPDNDGDGISDVVDACPTVPGEPSTDPRKNGCPNPDRDGDTFDNDVDQCPDAAEVWNGIKDDDGCPDEGGRLLAVIDTKDPRLAVRLATPLRFGGTAAAPEIDKASTPTVRAVATELNRHHDWTLAVGARPDKDGNEAALARAQALVRALDGYTHHEGAAEAVGWDAVKKQPGSESGLGLLVLVAPPHSVLEPAKPLPAAAAPSAPPATPGAPPLPPKK